LSGHIERRALRRRRRGCSKTGWKEQGLSGDPLRQPYYTPQSGRFERHGLPPEIGDGQPPLSSVICKCRSLLWELASAGTRRTNRGLYERRRRGVGIKMKDLARIANELDILEKVQTDLATIAQRTDDRRRQDLIELRRPLSPQIAEGGPRAQPGSFIW